MCLGRPADLGKSFDERMQSMEAFIIARTDSFHRGGKEALGGLSTRPNNIAPSTEDAEMTRVPEVRDDFVMPPLQLYRRLMAWSTDRHRLCRLCRHCGCPTLGPSPVREEMRPALFFPVHGRRQRAIRMYGLGCHHPFRQKRR